MPGWPCAPAAGRPLPPGLGRAAAAGGLAHGALRLADTQAYQWPGLPRAEAGGRDSGRPGGAPGSSESATQAGTDSEIIMMMAAADSEPRGPRPGPLRRKLPAKATATVPAPSQWHSPRPAASSWKPGPGPGGRRPRSQPRRPASSESSRLLETTNFELEVYSQGASAFKLKFH